MSCFNLHAILHVYLTSPFQDAIYLHKAAVAYPDIAEHTHRASFVGLKHPSARNDQSSSQRLAGERKNRLAINLDHNRFSPFDAIRHSESGKALAHENSPGLRVGPQLENRDQEKADRSIDVPPFIIHSANSLPTIGPRQNPWPENPAAIKRFLKPGARSIIGI
jgi:hypothetical protein